MRSARLHLHMGSAGAVAMKSKILTVSLLFLVVILSAALLWQGKPSTSTTSQPITIPQIFGGNVQTRTLVEYELFQATWSWTQPRLDAPFTGFIIQTDGQCWLEWNHADIKSTNASRGETEELRLEGNWSQYQGYFTLAVTKVCGNARADYHKSDLERLQYICDPTCIFGVSVGNDLEQGKLVVNGVCNDQTVKSTSVQFNDNSDVSFTCTPNIQTVIHTNTLNYTSTVTTTSTGK